MASEDVPLLNKTTDGEGRWENPVKSGIQFANRICDNFTWQFALTLASAYIGVKGFLLTVVGIGQVPFYKDYLGLPAGTYQSLKAIGGTPWATKPLIGALSDSLPLFGYHKRSYIFIVSVFSLIGLIVVSILPKADVSGQIAAAMFFLINLGVATTDLLLEGKYAEKMREKPETGSDLVSWVWGLVSIGTLLGSCVAGPVSEAGYPRLVFLICIPFALQVLVPILMGWLPEERVPEGSRHLRTEKFYKQPRLFLLGFFVGGGALFLAIIGETSTALVQLICSVVVSLIACGLALWWLPRVLGNAIVYLFLASVLYIPVDGATTYFFLATPQQLPDGPHFSNIYFFTYTAVVGSVASMLGVSLFQLVLSKSSFRFAFWTTTIVQCCAAFIDVVIVKRWNETVLGIPDEWFYMFGDAMIGGVIGMLNFMPAIVLTSKVCPKGVEALVYALLAGFQNFGGTVSSYIGAYVIDMAGIKTNPTQLPWDFSTLPVVLVICHMVLPLLCVPLVFLLIPDAKMTDEFVFSELDAPDDLSLDNNNNNNDNSSTDPRKVAPHEA